MQLIAFDDIPADGDPIGLIDLPIIPGTVAAISTGADILLDNVIMASPGQTLVRGFTFGARKPQVGKLTGFWTAHVTGVIVIAYLTTDTGGFTVKFWKKAAGSAKPTSSDSINTTGITITSGTDGTHKTILDLSDFTTIDVTKGDTFAVEITALSGTPLDLGGEVVIVEV